jgi:GPH family glycoside/pentoside/hexuronide:cation symporter
MILVGVTVLMILGLTMVSNLGYYVSVYHVFGGDKSELSGRIITFGQWSAQICTVLSVPVLTRVSKKIGKKGTLYIAMGLAIIGSMLKWVCYTPSNPWLLLIPGMVMSSGLAATWTLINSMIPDVVDVDELKTGERREGMYSAIYSWMFKIGLSLSLVISGYVLHGSGFNASLGAAQDPQAIFTMRVFFSMIPVVSITLAVLLLMRFPLNEKRAYEVREELRLIRLQRQEASGGMS